MFNFVQPHAGGGKGFYFIPEIGEEVWVDFEDQNAERPFVVGSHYNGNQKSGFATNNNKIKAIQTRSGHKLIFNEDESIIIADKSGNEIKLDTNGGNIEISAPQNIYLNAGNNMDIQVGNNLNFSVGNTAMMNIFQKMFINTPFMQQLVADYFHTQAGKALINSENEIKIEARETNVAGTQKLLMHSDEEATVNSKGVAQLHGEKKNNYGNKATNYEIAPPTTIENAMAIVHFRPKYDWQGEFGFDYFRENTDFIKDSENYRDILGRYYSKTDNEITNTVTMERSKGTKISNLSPFYIRTPNEWYIGNMVNFKPDPQYIPSDNNKLKDEYKYFSFTKIQTEKEKEQGKIKQSFEYLGSYIALFPQTANYGLSEAEIQLNISTFDKKTRPDYFIFKVGGLELTANHTHCITMVAPKVKEIDVILVDVNMYKGYGNIYQHSNWKDFFKKITSQALLKVNFIEKGGG